MSVINKSSKLNFSLNSGKILILYIKMNNIVNSTQKIEVG